MLDQFDLFHAQLDAFYGYIVGGCVHHRAFPLADPCLAEDPPHHLVALLIAQDDSAVSPLHVACQYGLVKVPQLMVFRYGSNGELFCAKPCKICQEAIAAYQPTEVWYSDNGTMVKL